MLTVVISVTSVPASILFFKIMSFHTDVSETERCPQGYCWKLKVNLVGGSVKKMRSCADIPIRPYTATKPEVEY